MHNRLYLALQNALHVSAGMYCVAACGGFGRRKILWDKSNKPDRARLVCFAEITGIHPGVSRSI
jgi:hypothetical protein